MPAWDAESPSSDDSPDSVQLERLRDDVRIAAQQDAAEIVSRARRDIRRVVTDARRELLELSAQLQAVNVTLPDAALPDPSVIADEELPAIPVQPGNAGPRWLEAAADEAPAPAEPRPIALAIDEPAAASRRWIPLLAIAAAVVIAAFAWFSRHAAQPSAQATRAGETASGAPTQGSATAPGGTPSAAAGGPDASPAAAAATPARAVTLDLTWRRPTWVRTTVDGSADVGQVYEAGATRHLEADAAIVLRAGDAGALVVSLNGAAPAPLGPDGTTLTRQFARPAPATAPPAAPATPAVTAGATPGSEAPSAAAGAPTAAPSSAAASAPAAPGTVPSDIAVTPRPVTGRVDLTVSSQQWLEAYHRQDRGAMETVGGQGAIVSDDRRPDQRFPFGLEVSRRFEDVGLNLAGDTAVYTGRMIERAATGEHVSRVSQTWVRRQGVWRLQEGRLSADAAAPRP